MTAKIAVQLYSLREEAEKDFPGVLARLGRIGYAGVETAGLHGFAPREVRHMVEDAGMEICSTHSMVPLGDDAEALLDVQAELGCKTYVVPMFRPDRFDDIGAVEKSAEDLNAANELARARGIRLGYHNHHWEFSTKFDGVAAHEKLYSMLDESVFAEIDTYWALVGGADPAAVLKGLGARAPFVHIKDGPADDPASDMVAVGKGALDTAAVVTATDDMEWHIVELDRCATDMFEAIEQSFEFLTKGGYSLGQS